MSFRPFGWSTGAGVLLSLVVAFGQTVTQVNLTATASPQQGGVPTTVTVLGGNFPAGTISPGSVTVTMTPAAGSGAPAVNMPASGVALVTGTTRRVTFVTPATIGGLVSPVLYQITIAGATTTGLQFRSTGSAAFLALPPAGIASLSPASGSPGERLSITLRGRYTNFIQNGTRVSFGSGITTGGSNLNQAWDSVASLVCRRPRSAPKVNAGNDTNAALGCNPDCNAPSATLRLNGSVTEYSLPVGGRLTPSWQVVTGPGAVTFANPNALSTDVTFSQPGIYRLELAVNDGELTGKSTVQVIVSPYQAFSSTSFTLDPAVSGPNPTGTSVALRARWLDVFSSGIIPRAFLNVEFRVTGANPRTVRAITDDLGYATLVLNGANAGSDQVVARALDSGRDTNAATVQWATPQPLITTGPVTGTFYQADGSGVFNIAKTATPVFTQVFPSVNFNPVSEFKRPFTYVFADGVASVEAAGNGYKAGVRELFHFAGAFTGVLNVPAAGDVTLTVANADGFVLGMGGGATRVSGPLVGAGATTTMQSYPVVAASNARVPGLQTLVVRFPAAGAYPYELDFAKGGDGKLKLVLGDGSGVALGAASSLQISPVNVSSAVGGTTRTFTVRAASSGGTVLAGLPVAVRIEGLNAQTRTVTTDGTGVVSFNYLGRQASGVDTVSAAAVVGGVTLGSNVVTVPWNNGANVAPVVSAGPGSTVVFPGFAALQGSASDDGLPGVLSVSWSRVSGPGTVTFDDAGQAVTAAKFSVAGVYVLRLTASDGGLSAFSEVTVTVVADPNWSSGWIANPLDKSSVSEPVPVRLISGITLTSGRLIYRSMTDPLTENVLNAAVSGAGQIGTFDPTGLPNGSYFIELRATSSTGVTQSNIVLVTVNGEYKPGRLVTTVTDLAVPTVGTLIRIERTYDSLLRNERSDFGYGWSLSVKTNLQVDPAGNVTLTIGGKRRTFYFTPPANALFQYWYTPSYTGERGFPGRLETTGDNCSGVLIRVGNVWQCAIDNAGAAYTATGFVYTEPTGRRFTIGGNGDLREIRDRQGNAITVTANGIFNQASGLSIPFERDAQGRIVKISEPGGRQYLYSYGADGVLASVQFPGKLIPIRYEYDSNRFLVGELDAKGVRVARSTYDGDGRLQSTTDSLGNTRQFSYDLAGRKETITNPDGTTSSAVSDSYGLPIRLTSPLGAITLLEYDSEKRLITETDPLGLVTRFEYNSGGFLTAMTRPLGLSFRATLSDSGAPIRVVSPGNRVQDIQLDPQGRISQISDALGPIGTFTYTANGLTASATDGRGSVTQFEYDANGNQLSKRDALGRVSRRQFDEAGNATAETDEAGRVTNYAYDAAGRLISVRRVVRSAAAEQPKASPKLPAVETIRETKYEYDENDNLVSETDPLNRKISYQYDVLNRLIKTTWPDGSFTANEYDTRGFVTKSTDQRGVATKYVYDADGRMTAVTSALGTPEEATERYVFDVKGQLIQEVDPLGFSTTFEYDAAGRIVKATYPGGKVGTAQYDPDGNIISVLTTDGMSMQQQYNARNKVIQINLPDGGIEKNEYDLAGQRTSFTDQSGNITRWRYDAAGRVLALQDPLGSSVEYQYDAAGNVIRQIDEKGAATQYTYDDLGNRLTRTLPLGMTETLGYDTVGNVTSLVDFRGRTTRYAYDIMDRLVSVVPDPISADAGRTFTYDLAGHLASMSDSSGATVFEYNNQGRLSRKVAPAGTLTYRYDAVGNLTRMTSGSGATDVSYTYDSYGNLATVLDNVRAQTFTNNWRGTTDFGGTLYPNNVLQTIARNSGGKISANTYSRASANLESFSYAFTPTGRISSVAQASGRQQSFQYDANYRLVAEVIAGAVGPRPNGSITHSYDRKGNHLAKVSNVAGVASVSQSFDANDRNTSIPFTDDGSQSSIGGKALGFSHDNRLTSFDSGNVQFVYNARGEKVSRQEGAVVVNYLVDSENPTGFPQIVEEIVGGQVQTSYVYGMTRLSQSRLTGSSIGTSYYGYDSEGNVRFLTNQSGTITDRYDYDGFGNMITKEGQTPNRFLYQAEEFDPAMGLYFMRARWYDPVSGRFVSADDYEGQIGDPTGYNPYSFANNDPVNLSDPSGNSAIERSPSFGVILRQSSLALRNPRIAGLTWGRIARAADTAVSVACILVQTWSVLDLVNQQLGSAPADGLAALDTACQLYAVFRPGFPRRPGRPPGGPGGGGPRRPRGRGGNGNNQQHRRGVDQCIDDFRTRGWEILTQELPVLSDVVSPSANGSRVPTRIDVLVERFGQVVNLEVKTGSGGYTPNQTAAGVPNGSMQNANSNAGRNRAPVNRSNGTQIRRGDPLNPGRSRTRALTWRPF